MRPSRIGAIAILITCAVDFAGPPLASAQVTKSTWGQILIADGPSDSRVDLYDPASNRFAPEIATPRMKHRTRATGTLLITGPNAGKVLLVGGDNTNDIPRASTELYDPATNTVVDGPAMKFARSGHTATAIPIGPDAGKILIAGGMSPDRGDVSLTELYDPASNTFSSGPAMRTASALHAATVIPSGKNAGKILINDSYESHSVLGSTELYDPAANTFEPGPIMHPACPFATATVIPSGKYAGKILFAGCEHLGEPGNDDSTELYDPATNKFVDGPTMKSRRSSHTATVISLGPNAGRILIAGGERRSNNETGRDASLASTELYDPETNTIAPGPAMNKRRVAHTATVILSGKNAGKILIAGGIEKDTDKNGSGIVLKLYSTELYDPATNTFAPGPMMNLDRFDAVAVQLPPAPPAPVRPQ
jgi:hypothetical protein